VENASSLFGRLNNTPRRIVIDRLLNEVISDRPIRRTFLTVHDNQVHSFVPTGHEFWSSANKMIYKEDFYFVDRFHSLALHGERCIADCEVHMNSADESICLLTYNVRNEVVTIHRSHEVLKMLFLLNAD
jgi:hypothetical protein